MPYQPAFKRFLALVAQSRTHPTDKASAGGTSFSVFVITCRGSRRARRNFTTESAHSVKSSRFS